MARTKPTADLEITVDGEPYVWRLHRRPQWSSDTNTFVGMAIAVRHKEGQREVMVEFPAGRQPRYGAPLLKASNIDTKIVARAIVSAIGTGWEPLSRGKTVSIVVDETGA